MWFHGSLSVESDLADGLLRACRAGSPHGAGGKFFAPGRAVAFAEEVDAAAGRIDMTITPLDDSTGSAGAGLLAAMLFEARGVGSTTLTVSGSAMSLDGGLVSLNFGQATVTVE